MTNKTKGGKRGKASLSPGQSQGVLVGDALVFSGSVGGVPPVCAVVIGQPERKVFVIEEQTLEYKELV